MVAWMLMIAAAQAAPDTVRIDVATALQRGLDLSPALEVAQYRAEAADYRFDQVGAWPNPLIGISAENVGQQRDFTGQSGLDGLEGQAVFTLGLPLGWERSGAISAAGADRRRMAAAVRVADWDVRETLLGAIGGVLRDQELGQSALEELTTLSRIANALALQAERGRASDGDAARAALARGMASTRHARRMAALAEGRAELARLLGYPATETLRIDAPACTDRSMPTGATTTVPELDVAQAGVHAARAAIQQAKGVRAPDLAPQVGVRRTGGRSGLFLGLSTTLPLWDRGSARIQAARGEEMAALAAERQVTERLASARVAAREGMVALESGGAAFDEDWSNALDRAVTAAEARYELGEGTLFELLDSRRARLQALDDYHAWLAEWWAARARLARLEGRAVDADLICLDPFRETP
ncbi:MAG: TolC family protein [Gemmatimonadetes bacterium]|nr:TolC family protein [Gemmatimonadota bacterium]